MLIEVLLVESIPFELGDFHQFNLAIFDFVVNMTTMNLFGKSFVS